MKHELPVTLLLVALALASTAAASTTWYVNGVSGSDSNNCMSTLTCGAQKLIGEVQDSEIAQFLRGLTLA